MKRIGQAAVLAILLSVPLAGAAQEKKAAAAPAAKPAAKPAPAKPETAPAKPAAAPVQAAPEKQPAARPAADASRRSRAKEDARACLQHPTNLEVHRCAHDYR